MPHKEGNLTFYTLDEALDTHIGKKGTKAREEYDFEVKLGILGGLIKQIRKERGLTRQQLGELIGLGKGRISKIENSGKNLTIETVRKIFKALNAEVSLKITVNKDELEIL
jgi:HTH-type transcriptional regulator / antitoxin HipB